MSRPAPICGVVNSAPIDDTSRRQRLPLFVILFLTSAQGSWWIFTQNILKAQISNWWPQRESSLKHSSVANSGTTNKNFQD